MAGSRKARSAEIPSITVIGAGRLGSVLCEWIAGSGLQLDAIANRSSRRASYLARKYSTLGRKLPTLLLESPIVLLAVPDDAIDAVAEQLRALSEDWHHRVVLHTSGNRSSDELRVLREAGAAVGSLHPLMTFAPRVSVDPRGIVFAVEGDAQAQRMAARLVRHWGGISVPIRPGDKPAYHLAATFASPMVTIAFAAAARTASRLSISPVARQTITAGLLRLSAQTVSNLKRAPAHAWTGPLARGDAVTVRSQLKTASKLGSLAEYYRAAALTAIELLPVPNRKSIRSALSKP